MSEVLVSVIMPVYNSGIFLEGAVNSILNQSLKEIELILVDDGSSDGSEIKCDQFRKNDQRVVVLHQKNKGICMARNEAIKIARGRYIAFSDHDDICNNNMLFDNFHFANKHGLDFVKFCREEYKIGIDGKITNYTINKAETQLYKGSDIPKVFYDLYDKRIFACVWDGLYKREFIWGNNILFNPKYKSGGEDYMFLLSCLKHANNWAVNGKCYYTHYLRKSFSTSAKLDPLRDVVLKDLVTNTVDMLKSHDDTPQKQPVKFTHFYIREYIVGCLTFFIRKRYNYSKFKQRTKMLSSDLAYFGIVKKSKLSWEKDWYYNIIRLLFTQRLYFILFAIFYFKTPKQQSQ